MGDDRGYGGLEEGGAVGGGVECSCLVRVYDSLFARRSQSLIS